MTQEPRSQFVTKVLLRQSIASIRLVIALFTVASALTKLLYSRFSYSTKFYRFEIDVRIGEVLCHAIDFPNLKAKLREPCQQRSRYRSCAGEDPLRLRKPKFFSYDPFNYGAYNRY